MMSLQLSSVDISIGTVPKNIIPQPNVYTIKKNTHRTPVNFTPTQQRKQLVKVRLLQFIWYQFPGIKASVQETGEKVAIKKAQQDKKYKNRELQNFRTLGEHPNILSLKTAFYIVGQNDDVFINFVTEYVPENLAQVIKNMKKAKKQITNNQIKILAFQLLRALAYMHEIIGKNMVHRDLKPQNILIDTQLNTLKICDLGSAKIIQKGQTNTSYLCARYYRAPELIFGSTDYTLAIDTWSAGCIIAELVLQEPLFPGESSVDQLVEIMKVLGTPSPADIASFNVQNTQDFKFPQVKAHPWSKVFLKYKPDLILVDIIKRMLVYNPAQRLKPFDALQHVYFEDLKDKTFGDGTLTVPELWNFTPDEIQLYGLQTINQMVPEWAKKNKT